MHAQKSSGIGAGLLLGVLVLAATADGATPWTSRTGDYALSWDLHADVAQLVQTSTGRSVWHGPLLPGFWLQAPGGERRFVKAEVDPASIAPGPAGGTLGLRLPGMGGGALRFSVEAWGIRFHELRVTWDGTPPAILGLYFGSAPLTEEQRTVVPSLELPFWPVGVPKVTAFPVAKAVRCRASSAIGTWPRHISTGQLWPFSRDALRRGISAASLQRCHGGQDGWVAFGPGTIPDAALTFEIRATTGTLHYLYGRTCGDTGRPHASLVRAAPFRLGADGLGCFPRTLRFFRSG